MAKRSGNSILEVVTNDSSDNFELRTARLPNANVGGEIDLSDSAYFENRELSYLEFNLRVLSQAKNPKHPLLERLNFLSIFSSNLDEYFEIRVSGLKKQLNFGRQRPGADGNYPEQILKIILNLLSTIHKTICFFGFALNLKGYVQSLPVRNRKIIHWGIHLVIKI